MALSMTPIALDVMTAATCWRVWRRWDRVRGRLAWSRSVQRMWNKHTLTGRRRGAGNKDGVLADCWEWKCKRAGSHCLQPAWTPVCM